MSFTRNTRLSLWDGVDTIDIAGSEIFETVAEKVGLAGDLVNYPSPKMTSNTAPSPLVASASTTLGNYYPWAAFDGNKTNSGSGAPGEYIANATTGWLKLDFGSGNNKIIRQYKIMSRAGSGIEAALAPKNWTLEGSNNNIDWTVIDTRNNETGWGIGQTRTYSVSVPGSYRYYRLNVSANNDHASYWGIQELEFFQNYPTISPSPGQTWNTLPSGTVVDMSTARLLILKDGVVQAETSTDVKFRYAVNNGALNATWLTLAGFRLEADPTIMDETNSIKIVPQFNSDGTYKSGSTAFMVANVIYPSGGGGGASIIGGTIVRRA